MQIDQVRFQRQVGIVKNWANNFNGQGTLEAVTGFGKTMVGQVAHRWLMKYAGVGAKTVVIVPTLPLKEQWERIARESKWEVYEIWTIQSFIRQETMDCDLLILDEIHMYKAEQFRRCFDIAVYQFVLGLTATLDDTDPRHHIIDLFAPVVSTIKLDEALDNRWISPYRVYNLGVKLEPAVLEEYQEVSASFGKCKAFFNHDFELMMKCYTQKKWREAFAADYQKIDPEVNVQRIFLTARKGANAMRRRKQILYESTAKLDVAVDICREHPERKIIVFGQSIEAAEYIRKQLGREAEAYHSKIKARTINGKKVGSKTVKKQILERFCKPDVKLHVLATAKAMDMGVDIPVLDTGIVVAGTSKSLQNIQRLGRIVRKTKDKIAIWVEIYALDTQDMRWLNQRQSDIPEELIQQIDHHSEITWT
jgi:superfamily II DNA or RNA helicase